MSTNINIVIAADFALAEKIADFLTLSDIEPIQLRVAEIYPFAEEQGLRFRGKSVAQIPPEEMDWASADYVFFGGDLSHAEWLAKMAVTDCVVIDVKGVCAALSDVPLVVPGVNEQQLINLRQRHIVSLPDPQVVQLALALESLPDLSGVAIFVSSLLPAAYQDGEQVSRLVGQAAQLLNGIPLDEGQTRLAFDVFPKADALDLNGQLQKIFPNLAPAVFHQIQVPVFYGLAQMVSLSGEAEDAETLSQNWQGHDFIRVHDTPITPVLNGEAENDEDEVALHISNIQAEQNGVRFWSVCDEQRFAQGFMAVKLFEAVYRQGY